MTTIVCWESEGSRVARLDVHAMHFFYNFYNRKELKSDWMRRAVFFCLFWNFHFDGEVEFSDEDALFLICMTKAPDFFALNMSGAGLVLYKKMKIVIKSEHKAVGLIGFCHLSWEAEPKRYSFLFQLSDVFCNFDCVPCFWFIHLHCLSKQRPWVFLSILLTPSSSSSFTSSFSP